jgi:hypothetical protein
MAWRITGAVMLNHLLATLKPGQAELIRMVKLQE